MLASTVQFSTYGKSLHHPHRQTPTQPPGGQTSGTTSMKPFRDNHPTPLTGAGPFPQDPTACLRPAPPTTTFPTTPKGGGTSGNQRHRPNWSAFHPRAPPPTPAPTPDWASITAGAWLWTTPRMRRPVLLRKEVIQPHLPVRLPCYDFVPIADPAFDGSLPQGVGPPASGVTDFRDVAGGVYKARERIHRSVADLRLLATPTSWGRVADPNPN